MIKAILKVNKHERPSVAVALNHIWLKEVTWFCSPIGLLLRGCLRQMHIFRRSLLLQCAVIASTIALEMTFAFCFLCLIERHGHVLTPLRSMEGPFCVYSAQNDTPLKCDICVL